MGGFNTYSKHEVLSDPIYQRLIKRMDRLIDKQGDPAEKIRQLETEGTITSPDGTTVLIPPKHRATRIKWIEMGRQWWDQREGIKKHIKEFDNPCGYSGGYEPPEGWAKFYRQLEN